MAMARSDGSASIHSMATEPEPAPMSHSNSPRRGASADSVSARISRLVIWPSCSNRSSARPGVSGRMRASVRRLDFDRHDVERIDVGAGRSGRRGPMRMRSRAPPSASSTVSRRIAEPAFAQAARRPPPGRSRPRSARAPGARDAAVGASSSTGLPCSEIVSISGSGQPSRAAARLKAEGAGKTRHFRGRNQPRDGRADAVQERVARGEHADAAAAERQHDRAWRRRKATAIDAIAP